MSHIKYFYPDKILINGQSVAHQKIIELLEPFAGKRRVDHIRSIAYARHNGIIPVLDEIYDMGNITAVMRSAEAFGLFNMVLFNNIKVKPIRKVSKNSDKWLNIHSFERNNKLEIMRQLSNDGLQIVSTALTHSSCTIDQIPMDRPIALVLGNEKDGVAQEIQQISDYCVKIPMKGFSQSLNISVAAGILMNQILSNQTQKACKYGPSAFSEQHHRIMYAHYLMKAIQESEKLIAHQIQKL